MVNHVSWQETKRSATKCGLARYDIGHMLGYLADTDIKAADDFFPGYARTFTNIGKERGWPPVTRTHFDALLEPEGALLIGTPETVATKIRGIDRDLGGIDRLTLQISVADLDHDQTLSTIGLTGEVLAEKFR